MGLHPLQCQARRDLLATPQQQLTINKQHQTRSVMRAWVGSSKCQWRVAISWWWIRIRPQQKLRQWWEPNMRQVPLANWTRTRRACSSRSSHKFSSHARLPVISEACRIRWKRQGRASSPIPVSEGSNPLLRIFTKIKSSRWWTTNRLLNHRRLLKQTWTRPALKGF